MKRNPIFKLIVLSALAFSTCVSAMAHSNTAFEKPLSEVIDLISEKYSVIITYNAELLSEIDIYFEFRVGEEIESAVNRALNKTNFKYKQLTEKYHVVYDNTKSSKKNIKKLKQKFKEIQQLESTEGLDVQLTSENPILTFDKVITATEDLITQVIIVSGVVRDAEGEPLIGVTVLEAGTTNGTSSDIDGSFELSVQEGATLQLSFIGYVTQRVEITNQTNFEIVMAEDATALDEIIVVGFAEQRSSKVTAAVSQISSEELALEQRPVTNVQSALVGSLPGLRGFNATGTPGATPNFSIRGVSSLNGTGNNVLVIIDDFEGSLDDVNPQDIQTVSVLKDAAAVAVYGARGANGVLLITTKKTSRNKRLQVNYNALVSSQSRGNLAEMLDASELIAFENLAVTGDPTGGGNPSAPYSPTVIGLANSGFYPETQWVDELYETSARQHSHNLSLQGGLENVGFLLSAGFLDQNGLVKGIDNFKRFNVRMKVDVDINDWLTIGTNTVVTSRIRDQVPVSTGNALLGSPLFPVQTEDGVFVDKGSPGEANPIALAQSGSFRETVSDAINMQLYAKISPIKNLSFDQRVSVIRNNSKVRDFDNVYDFVRLDFSDQDSYTNPDSPNRTFVPGIPDARRLSLTSANDYTLTYLSRVNYGITLGNHNFGALLGFQAIQGQAEAFQAGRQGFLLDNPVALSLGQNIAPVSGDPLGNTSFRGGNATTLSLFGRLNYDFKGKYIAELSFRRDGSSNFLESNRFGFFPSVSAAWNIAAEPFMSGADGLDRLKLRASYGTTGDDSGIARSVTQFANVDVTSYPFGGVVGPGIFLGSPASRDLKWETATILNFGVDLSMWEGRFQMNAEYFINNRDDILDFAITPTEFGFGNVPANLYAVKSWGWD